MKNTFFILIGLFFLLLISACAHLRMRSEATDKLFKIDGNSNDWQGVTLTFAEDMNIMLGTAHSAGNLYFMFRFNDPALARMFAARGMTVWFKDELKKEHGFGIRYKNELDPRFAGAMNPGRRERSDIRALNSSIEQIIREGFFSVVVSDTVRGTVDEYDNIAAAVDVKDGLYCFEMAVPLTKDAGGELAVHVGESGKIELGVEVNAPDDAFKETMKDGRGRGMSVDGGGSSGRGGMRGGGGRRSGMAGSPSKMPVMDSREIWLTVQIIL